MTLSIMQGQKAPWFYTIPVFLIIATLSLNARSFDTPKDYPFQVLKGEFAVGTVDLVWVDEGREETLSDDPDDKRHLFIKIWYPANKESVGNAALAPYIPSLNELDNPEYFRPLSLLSSRSYLNIPISQKKPNYPVLVYNHGGGEIRFSGSFVTEELASQGYIVVSIGHPGFNLSSRFPDWYVFKNDWTRKWYEENSVLLESKSDKDKKIATEIRFDYYGELFEIWRKDAKFVLDKLALINKSDSFFSGYLDVNKLGMLGWSFGGALSIQMTHDDPRVRAAVLHDGALFGDIFLKGTNKPVMLMHGKARHKETESEGKSYGMEKWIKRDNLFSQNTSSPWYELDIKGEASTHQYFSDRVLFDKKYDIEKAHRTHEIIIDHTLRFFDRYLKNESNDFHNVKGEDNDEFHFRSFNNGSLKND